MSRSRQRFTKRSMPLQQTIDVSSAPGTTTYLREGGPDEVLTHEYHLDVVGNKGGFNPCAHVHVNCLPAAMPMYAQLPPWWDPWGSPHMQYYVGTYLPNGFRDGYIAPAIAGELGSRMGHLGESEAGAFNRAAFDKVMDQIPQEVDITNFLRELKDIKPVLSKAVGLLKNLASGYLWWNFAALPVIGDVQKLINLIGTVSKRLDHLKKINNRTVTISHVDTFILHDSDTPPADLPGHPDLYRSAEDHLVARLAYHKVQARVNMQVYTSLDLMGADTLLHACASALGLYNPQGVIWNAIPFSFVVDWFVRIGDWLDQYEIQPFKGTVQILGVSSSMRSQRFYTIWSPTSLNTWEKASTALVRSYHRFPGIPEGTLLTDGLTSHQQSLAAALVISMMPTRRGRKMRWTSL